MIEITEQTTTHTPEGKTRITVTIEIPAREHIGAPLDLERGLQRALNGVGRAVMTEALGRYDTEGEPVRLGPFAMTSKGRSPESYKSLFGPVDIERHVYQTSDGGRTFCPLEQSARVCENATIGLCAMLAAKHVNLSGRGLQRELALSHQLDLSLSYLQDVTSEFGKRALGKEDHWTYAPATAPGDAAALIIYVDGTCGAICEEGYKQIMVGAIDVLDAAGERLETAYIAHAPEEGKVTFLARMERELERLRPRYGDLFCMGLCDGAPDLQAWLEARCDYTTLDFYHVSEYVAQAAPAFAAKPEAQKAWLKETLHDLKHHRTGAKKLLAALTRKHEEIKRSEPTSPHRSALEAAERYVGNNIERMDYAGNRKLNVPIGSGVIEAACKHVVKQRVGCSGMRWKRKALQAVLTLRSLYQSTGRWEQFWAKVQILGW